MGDRRVWWGAAAVLLGVGAGLLSGSGTAAADTGNVTGAGTQHSATTVSASTSSVRSAPAAAAKHRPPSTASVAGARRPPSTAAKVTEARQGEAKQGEARQGAARQGAARQGFATGRTRAAAVASAPPTPGPAATVVINLLSGLGWQPRAEAAQALLSAPSTNGVTGVNVGHSDLEIPCGPDGYTARADWYFPTQADGTVAASGVIWLQHGFLSDKSFYSALATTLAQQTNSIVVAPNITSFPFACAGCWLGGEPMQQAVAAMFVDPNRVLLNSSAIAAGFTGVLPEQFVLSGHSAGGGLAIAAGGSYAADPGNNGSLLGIVMFDGVSLSGSAPESIQDLAGIPVYQIAAPPQALNLGGQTTSDLIEARPDQFVGDVLVGGSHVDSMLGTNIVIDFFAQLVTKFSPAGNTAAVYTLSAGWINDFYVGGSPTDPQYGFYGAAGQPIIMGDAAAIVLPQYGVSTAIPAASAPLTNGVTGVKVGHSDLDIAVGDTSYTAQTDWYFPTQADGSVQAQGVIWLQHGFLGFNSWYGALAAQLAQQTNSIVVAPDIPWFPSLRCQGCYLSGTPMQEGVAALFADPSRASLNISANAAGYQGTLPEAFVLSGHSAGGGLAAAAGGFYTDTVAPADNDLLGVVMYDGVSSNDTFAAALASLDTLDIPVYQIAAPPQAGNANGQTTDDLVALRPGEFVGDVLANGSHVDSFMGALPIIDFVAQLFFKRSSPGNTAAVYTLATGWINDMYVGKGPTDPQYGLYGDPDQFIVMGQTAAVVLGPPPVVDIDAYLGTWYEVGSVKQFFSIGLVNTKAVYLPNTDGSIKVENSGNYFFNNGPQSSIVGAALPVDPTNNKLNVSFFFPVTADPPGNYWIVDLAPDYSWAIVSDPTGSTGFLLSRTQFVSDALYQELLDRASAKGVNGWITRTRQYA